MTAASSVRARRDRWADWLVVGVVILALLLGWVVKAWAEGGTESFTDPETGLTLTYPSGWLMSSTGDYVFKARDPQSGFFKITYQVMADRLDPTRPISLVDAVNATAVSRARKLTAFRLLDIVPMDDGGQVLPSNMEVANEELKLPSAIWVRYVYVRK